MTRTAKPKVEINGIRAEMIRNSLACNKFLTREFLQIKSNEELLCFVHPFDRVDFAVKLGIKNPTKLVDPDFD